MPSVPALLRGLVRKKVTSSAAVQLPPELWRIIFNYFGLTVRQESNPALTRGVYPLLFVCRIFRYEAERILYHTLAFYVVPSKRQSECLRQVTTCPRVAVHVHRFIVQSLPLDYRRSFKHSANRQEKVEGFWFAINLALRTVSCLEDLTMDERAGYGPSRILARRALDGVAFQVKRLSLKSSHGFSEGDISCIGLQRAVVDLDISWSAFIMLPDGSFPHLRSLRLERGETLASQQLPALSSTRCLAYTLSPEHTPSSFFDIFQDISSLQLTIDTHFDEYKVISGRFRGLRYIQIHFYYTRPLGEQYPLDLFKYLEQFHYLQKVVLEHSPSPSRSKSAQDLHVVRAFDMLPELKALQIDKRQWLRFDGLNYQDAFSNSEEWKDCQWT